MVEMVVRLTELFLPFVVGYYWLCLCNVSATPDTSLLSLTNFPVRVSVTTCQAKNPILCYIHYCLGLAHVCDQGSFTLASRRSILQ